MNANNITVFIIIFWIIGLFSFYAIPVNFFKKYQETRDTKYLVKSIRSSGILILIYFLLYLIPSNLQKPQINITIMPSNDPCLSTSEYPLHEYRFQINNNNKNSANISNFYTEFFFPYTVVNTSISENIYTGGPGRLLGLAGCRRDTIGKMTHLYSIKSDGLNYASIEPLRENSNIAIFKCASMPRNVIIYGTITVDLTKKPEFIDRPDEIGIFRAIYDYDIKSYIGDVNYQENKFNGGIPEADSTETKGEMYFNLGLDHLEKKVYEKAISYFNQCLELVPKHEYALKQRGYCYGVKGEYDLSIKDFSKCIELAPKDKFVYFNRAISKIGSKDYEGAKQDLFKSFQLGNDNAFKELLLLGFQEKTISSNSGFIEIDRSKKDWLNKNKGIINIIPKVEFDDFKIHAFKDRDHIFKVIISNNFSENVELKFDDFDWLVNKKNSPKHTIKIAWGNKENRLIIDDALVDVNPITLESGLNDKPSDSYFFDLMKSRDPKKGVFSFSFGAPDLFDGSDTVKQIIPHIYRNGVEINIYKDNDNVLKVLMSNKCGNSFILEYKKLNNMIEFPGYQEYKIAVKWSEEKTKFYVDDRLVDSYPNEPDEIKSNQ
jgi:tetratricopeptide (TPR) repeat protein